MSDDSYQNYESLDGEAFKSKFQHSVGAELLDVRTAGEFASGSITGARNLDITNNEFQEALRTMDKDKEYFVICHRGTRSAIACRILSGEGFRAFNLIGGIGEWPD